MKRILVVLFMILTSGVVFAEEITPTQTVKNENSYLGINFEKQPDQESGKQLITNKKSFLFINIVINGKVQNPNTTDKK